MRARPYLAGVRTRELSYSSSLDHAFQNGCTTPLLGAAFEAALQVGTVSSFPVTPRGNRRSFYNSLLISGLSYKTAFSNELLTSIFPL